MKSASLLLALSAAGALAADRLPIAGDFDGDGNGDAAFFDAASSTLEVGYDIAAPAPEWHTVDLRRHAYFDGRFLRVADLNSDGRTDLYTAGRDANRVLVLWGDANRSTGFVPETFTPGWGPAFADRVPDTERLAVPLLASATPAWHHFGPAARPNPTDWALDPSDADTEWLDFRSGRQTLAAVFNAATFGATIRTPGKFRAFQKRPLNDLSSNDDALPESLDRLTAFGFFGGAGNPPATVAFCGGATELVVLQIAAGAGANPPTITTTTHIVPAVGDARTIDTPGGDRLLVVNADGASASIFEIAGANLLLEQTLNPPNADAFLALSQDEAGNLVAAMAGNTNYSVFEHDGNSFIEVQRGAAPQSPPPSSGTQLVLYDAHPYGATPASQIETLPAGDWGSAPSLAGITISATLERLLDPLAGLGNPSPVNLDASVPVPAMAVPIGNQFQSDTSLDFGGTPSADGAAAVRVSPPGGRYASTIELQFLAAPGTTVHFRLGGGGWQSIAATESVIVDTSAQLEYYGTNLAALSAIQREDYLITQDPDADTDGDNVPDAIEEALNLSPFAGDTDGDGFSDFSEAVEGTDGTDPTSVPTEEVAFNYTRVEIEIEGIRPDGITAPPAIGTEVFIRTLEGGLLANATTDALTVPHLALDLDSAPQFIVVETSPVFPLSGLFFQPWPYGHRLAAVVEIPPDEAPTGPVNLNSNDIVGDWLAGVQPALALQKAKTAEAGLNIRSTLHALAIESWLAARLDALGRIAPGELMPQIIDEPVPGVRKLIDEDDLAAVREGTGTTRHDFVRAITEIDAEPTPVPLLDTVRDIYATSAGSDPALPLPPTPIAALRELFGEGTVPAAYLPDLADTPAALGDLFDALVGAPDPDTVVDTSGLLETDGTGCLVLVEPGLPPTRYELVDNIGLPYWQTENAPVLDGATAALVGYVLPNATPSCGDIVVEVVSLQVTAIPPNPVTDTDADDLPDDVESLLLGLLDGGFWDDPDGDGYTTGEELFLDPLNPSDPADGGNVPAGPPAIPANAQTSDGDHFVLEWDGNGAANYAVECSVGLDAAWAPTNVDPVEDPAGHFTWPDPDPLDDELRKFYRIIVQLDP